MIDLDSLKLPPYSKEAEQSVIGGLFLNNYRFADIAGVVKESDFYLPANALIFKAISALESKKKPFDVITVFELLESRNVIDDVGGMEYLASLANNTPSAVNIIAYAEIVRERSALRAIIKAANQITERAYDHHDNDSNSILEAAYDSLRLIQITGDTEVPSLMETMKSAFKQLEQRFNNKGELTGLSTGFTELDKSTNGLQKGEVYILAGRPSQGKSTLALNISMNIALQNKHVLFFSLEMPKERIIDKCWSSVGGVEFENIKTGKDLDWGMVTKANELILESGLVIDDQGDQTLDKIIVKAKRIHAKKKLDLIVVDYLQLVRVRGASRLDEVSEVSRQLKALAKNLECPIIALAQLNRSVETREDKRPRLADLRESGQIEQDADFISFIYRDEIYYPDLTMNKGIAEIIIAKHRFGETGMLMLRTELNKSRFLNKEFAINYIPQRDVKQEQKGGFRG